MPRPSSPVAALAESLGGDLHGDGAVVVSGVNTIHDAEPHEITLITTQHYARLWPDSHAGAAVVSRGIDLESGEADARPIIVVDDAEIASIRLLEWLHPVEVRPEIGIHPTACIHETARVSATARIGPHVSVEQGVIVGEEVTLHAGVRLYADVEVGEATTLHANCVVRERCRLGRRVLLHPNVTIGADGFGYRPAPDGSGLLKVPHNGAVRIEDDVEIGAGSCVDRGKFGDTVIGRGTKIDNLCQIAHNCRIGPNCVIAACAAMAGSVEMGEWVKIGGAVAIKEHIVIGAGASVGGAAVIMQDVAPGVSVAGFPADLVDRSLRQWISLRKLPEFMRHTSRQLRDLQ